MEWDAKAMAAMPIMMGKAPLQTIARLYRQQRFFFGVDAMRKLPPNLENPLDNLMIGMADAVSPWLRSTGHTPNILTTYSLGSAVLGLWALTQDRIGLFIAFWLMHPLWDNFDGHFARKYGMTSRFGDVYDHLVDNVTMLALMIILYRKYHIPVPVYIILAGLAINTVVHVGCQQRYIKGSGETLDSVKGACGDVGWLKITRWFSHASAHIILVGIVLYLEKYHRRDQRT